MDRNSQIVVCVPAKNEAERLPHLLAALAVQTVVPTVLVSVNNSTDASIDAIENIRRRLSGLHIVVDEVNFPPELAHAGSARRHAMELGAALAGPSGIVITTDADARPPPHWIAANLVALNRGLDIVGGRICLDDAEEIAPAIKTMVAMTDRYWAQVRAIEDAHDPIVWDAPPRHGDHTGASLALRVRDYVASGGVPLIASGEDRALVQAVCAGGGKLGHPPDVWTRVSARTAGRASAGMAQAMAGLLTASHDQPLMLPHFSHWKARATWRRRIREQYGSAEVAKREPTLPSLPCDMALTAPSIRENMIA